MMITNQFTRFDLILNPVNLPGSSGQLSNPRQLAAGY